MAGASWIPAPVDELLSAALVCEMTVVGARGQPVTHPLLPLWDGERIFVTSSVLFSRKLEHIKRDGRVSVAITDPAACGGRPARCTIQGDARVFEDDPHETWTRILPLWRAKEPAIDFFLGKRFALPLFFERSLVEITPRKVLWWQDGNVQSPPQVALPPEVGA
ncbi:MAG TPA: pyridoxamine 5'-phosphate oxidase family protein [Dehalococcoidia bacterium]|nr:pyridoxamine 5'-phosphate oxidase family protein [Dehalococcoidia bacterium]